MGIGGGKQVRQYPRRATKSKMAWQYPHLVLMHVARLRSVRGTVVDEHGFRKAG
jgi:hypothetical protein